MHSLFQILENLNIDPSRIPAPTSPLSQEE